MLHRCSLDLLVMWCFIVTEDWKERFLLVKNCLSKLCCFSPRRVVGKAPIAGRGTFLVDREVGKHVEVENLGWQPAALPLLSTRPSDWEKHLERPEQCLCSPSRCKMLVIWRRSKWQLPLDFVRFFFLFLLVTKLELYLVEIIITVVLDRVIVSFWF